MKITGITDVFFDLDHTLWDFDRNSALTFEKIFELNNISIDITDFLEQYVPINLKYWKLFREARIEKDVLRFGRLNDTFLALGKTMDDGVIHKLSDDYIHHLTTFNYLFEGTIEILTYLKPRYNLHIITNGFGEVQYKKLSRSKIDQFFNTITHSEMVGVKKPDPKIFNHALSLANTTVSNSVMIGDSYEADIIGAKNIGMKTIFLNIYNENFEDNVKQIHYLKEIKTYL